MRSALGAEKHSRIVFLPLGPESPSAFTKKASPAT
jgi:hypothetical protein